MKNLSETAKEICFDLGLDETQSFKLLPYLSAAFQQGVEEEREEWLTACKNILRHWTLAPAKETVEAFEHFYNQRLALRQSGGEGK